MKKEEFLYPKSSYHGQFSPQDMLFDNNLQDFSQRISIICALENNGKITPKEAYSRIKSLWKELKKSKRGIYNVGE